MSNVFTQQSGGPLWQPPATGVSGGAWTRVLSIDLRTQASQALTPDGNFVIAGVTFKTQNSAGPAMVQTLGTGITFTPPNPAQYTTALRTLPQLWVQLTQLAAAFAVSMPVRVWGLFADDPALLNCYQDIGLDTSGGGQEPSTVAGGGWASSSLRGFDTSNTQPAGAGEAYARHVLAGTQTDLAQSQVAIPGGLVAGNRLVLCESDHSIGHVMRTLLGPAVATHIPSNASGLSYLVGALQTAATPLKPVPSANVGAYWGAERVNAAGFSTVLQEIAVDLQLGAG